MCIPLSTCTNMSFSDCECRAEPIPLSTNQYTICSCRFPVRLRTEVSLLVYFVVISCQHLGVWGSLTRCVLRVLLTGPEWSLPQATEETGTVMVSMTQANCSRQHVCRTGTALTRCNIPGYTKAFVVVSDTRFYDPEDTTTPLPMQADTELSHDVR